MKTKITSFIIILFILLGCYIYFFSFIKVENDELGVVKDRNSQEIVNIFYNDINFIWQGSFPWMFSLYKISKKQSLIDTLKVNIPLLRNLKGDFYLISVPVKIIYQINPEKFSNNQFLRDSLTELESFIMKHFNSSYNIAIDRYVSPEYLEKQIIANKENILSMSFNILKKEIELFGIEVLNLEFSGSMVVPEYKIYLEGLKQLADLREIEKKNEKNLIAVINEIDKRKLQNKHFYEELNQISFIIKKNPDILKYIYIDKLSNNVKVILPAENSGIPKVFDDNYRENRVLKNGEIDNLN